MSCFLEGLHSTCLKIWRHNNECPTFAWSGRYVADSSQIYPSYCCCYWKHCLLHRLGKRERQFSINCVSSVLPVSYIDKVFIICLKLVRSFSLPCPPLYTSLGNVIIYGNTVDVYTTTQALLSLGISGDRIHLVHPPLHSNITSLNNNAIEMAVQKALSANDVSVHHDSLLAQWNDGNHPDPIEHASFTTKTKPFRLQCSVRMFLLWETPAKIQPKVQNCRTVGLKEILYTIQKDVSPGQACFEMYSRVSTPSAGLCQDTELHLH